MIRRAYGVAGLIALTLGALWKLGEWAYWRVLEASVWASLRKRRRDGR